MDYRSTAARAMTRILALALIASLLASCAMTSVSVTARVDTTLKPAVASVPDKSGAPQPVAALRSDAGRSGDLVESVLRVRPRSPAQLAEFLDRFDGVVIDDNEVPKPPPERGMTVTDEQRRATEFVVRIDLRRVDPRRLQSLAQKAGWQGVLTFSSDAGLRTFVAALAARAAGYRADANFLVEGHQQVLLATQEREITPPGTFTDALRQPRFGFNADGARANVGSAWQYFLAHGATDTNAEIAIIDQGFFLSPPGVGRGADHDYPFGQLWQTDLVNDDGLADEPAPAGWCGGNNCARHGAMSTSVAAGVLDNRRGVSGTGSVAGTPMLYRVSTFAQVDEAIMAASVWGADVLSLSLGGGLNTVDLVNEHLATAVTDDVLGRFVNPVFVASAGNINMDVGFYFRENGQIRAAGTPMYPCVLTHIICVGALNDNALTKINYSNFGAGVDLYAPTNIPVMSLPDNNDVGYAPQTFGGTSASAPFVAGVAAMMKGINPALSSDQVSDILRATGNAVTNPAGARAVDALAAVRRAAQGIPIRPDRFEPNNGPGAATDLGAPTNRRESNLNLDGGDRDYFAFNSPGPRLASIEVEFPEVLGPITLVKPTHDDSNVDDCPSPGFAGRTPLPGGNGFREEYFVTSGKHLFSVRANDVNAYNLRVSLRNGFVPEDPYEANDTYSTPTREPFFFFVPKDGGFELVPLHGFVWHATLDSRAHGVPPLHLADRDYYAITGHAADKKYISAALRQLTLPYSGVRVYANDANVTMRVYRSLNGELGAAVGAAVTAGPCGSAAIEVEPDVGYIVEITGARGRYKLHNGTQARRIPIPWLQQHVIDQILEPGGPVELAPRDFERRFITVTDPAFTGLQASGPGVHLRLLDERRDVVAEGAPSASGGELLSFANTRPGAAYVIETNEVPGGGMEHVRLVWQPASPRRRSENLLVNGDAELPSREGGAPAGWQRTERAGAARVVPYGNGDSVPACEQDSARCGRNLFVGGDLRRASLRQSIEIAADWKAAIANHRVVADFSAEIGGRLDAKEAADARATFLDANRRALGSIVFHPVTAHERQGRTGLVSVRSNAGVPQNTAYILVDLTFSGEVRAFNSAAVDNVQLTLTELP